MRPVSLEEGGPAGLEKLEIFFKFYFDTLIVSYPKEYENTVKIRTINV